MRRFLILLSVPVFAMIFAFLARPHSLGMKLSQAAAAYSQALSSGNAALALDMMVPSTSEALSIEFLARLEGTPVPTHFRFDGSDSRGLRMTGTLNNAGSRVIWFSLENGIKVTHDTALDNILGSAVIICRENALVHPDGCCPVSGQFYENNLQTGIVLCPEGHLGDGLILSSSMCFLRRDSVATELSEYLEAGYPYPESLEDIFVLSGEEFGKRGGYRCPDNGYKYYELRNGEIYCPFHEESSGVVVL